MSTTSTTTVTAQEIQSVLTDYKIHLTGDNSANEELIPTHAPAIAENPSNWPMNHRRVPDFRPIDRNRGVEERPNGSNPFEQGFLIVMFTGVVANATIAKIWGATGGPYFPRLFKYAIGGEW